MSGNVPKFIVSAVWLAVPFFFLVFFILFHLFCAYF
jgi:hypothetical protein